MQEHGVGPAPVLDLNQLPLPLSAAAVFGREVPLEVEIGSGKGRFTLEWAAAHPEVGVLAVERARSYLQLVARRACRRGLENLRLLHTTAEDALFRCLASGSVRAVHVYFPDPWPKKRHHKRRFFCPDNVAHLAEVLAPGGVLRVKTDHREYAEVIAACLQAEARLAPLPVEEAFVGVPPTSFELKYAREARQLYRFAVRRREDR